MEEAIEQKQPQIAERKITVGWDELSEILEKSGNFIRGEKIKEMTLMNPKKIKFILERKA